MKNITKILAFVLGLLPLFAHAGLPDNAYNSAADPLPAGAREVSAKDWAVLVRRPGFVQVNQLSRNTQLATAEKQLSQDVSDIRQAEKLRGVKLMPAEVTPDEMTRAQVDGNWLHTVQLKENKRQFTLMGGRWSKHAVATAIRTVGTRQNQLQMYERFYRNLDPKMIDRLKLINPDLIKKNPEQFPDAAIFKLNHRFVENVHELVDIYNSPWAQVFASKCEGNIGQGTRGDEFGNSGFCRFSSDGIYSNFAFPMQRDLTCVKDQDNRGSCTSFAITADLEYQVHKKSGQFVNLSEQALYNQTKLIWFRDDFQDGAWPTDILTQMETSQWPQPFENQWDYNPSHSRVATMVANNPYRVASYSNSCDSYTQTCSDTTHQGLMYCTVQAEVRYCGYIPPNINPGSAGYRVGGHGQVWDPADVDTSLSMMMLSLVFKNPIIWSFNVNYGWDTIDDAGFVKYYRGQPSRGAHATLIVGYITNATLARIMPHAPQAGTEGYFIVKNSWSNCFGDGGYAYVPYDYVKAYTLEASVIPGIQ